MERRFRFLTALLLGFMLLGLTTTAIIAAVQDGQGPLVGCDNTGGNGPGGNGPCPPVDGDAQDNNDEDADQDGGGEECDPDPTDEPGGANGASIGPIYFSGSIAERPVDFQLSSVDDVYFRQARYYGQLANALTVYHDETGGPTTATVEVTASTIVLKTDTTTNTLTLTDSGNATIGGLIDTINGLSNGWVATLSGSSAANSDDLRISPEIDAKGSGNEQALKMNRLTEMGYNWTHTYWAHLEKDGDTIQYWRDLNRMYTYDFTSASDNTFVWEDNMRIRTRLMHNMTYAPDNTYWMQKPNGVVWLFYDFHSSWNVNLRGKLWMIIGIYGDVIDKPSPPPPQTIRGNVIEIVREQTNWTIDYVKMPTSQHAYYDYTGGLLTSVNVYEGSAETAATHIARITYTYKADGDNNDPGTGMEDDLIKVQVETIATNEETGDRLKIERFNAYRYYDDSAYNATTNPGLEHELKMLLRGPAVAQAEAGLFNVLENPDDDIDDFANSQFEFTEYGRVSEEIVQGGTPCCGGAGAVGAYLYEYDFEDPVPTDRDDWAMQMKETRPDTSVRYVDTNVFGEIVFIALFQKDNDNLKLRRFNQFTRDDSVGGSGRIIEWRRPSAIDDYDPDHPAIDPVVYVDEGKVIVFKYEDDTKLFRHKLTKRYTWAEVKTSGPAVADGDMVELKTWLVAGTTWGYRSTILPHLVYEYPTETSNETGNGGVLALSYDFTDYWPDVYDLDEDGIFNESTDRPRHAKIFYPKVPLDENGGGDEGSDPWSTSHSFFDQSGRVRFTKDPEGNVTYLSYDKRTDGLGLRVVDPFNSTTYANIAPSEIKTPSDTNIAGWSTDEHDDLPTEFKHSSGSASDHLLLEDRTKFDTRARARSVTARDGQITFYAYMDDETRVYPSWDAINDEPRLPMSRSYTIYDDDVTSRATKFFEAADPANVTTFNDPPDGKENWPAQDDFVSLSKGIYNADSRIVKQLRWHDIPPEVQGDGDEVTNYYKTTYTYTTLDGDVSQDPYPTLLKGAGVEIRELVATGDVQWTMIIRNVAGQVTHVKRTTDVEGNGDPKNYRLITKRFYGEKDPGSGLQVGGKLTSFRSYHSSSSNLTEIHYDWNANVKLIVRPQAPHTVFNYDNQLRVTAVATYDSAFNLTNGTSALTAVSARVSLREIHYDTLNRIYQTDVYSIDSNGNVEKTVAPDTVRDKKLVTRNFYDRNDNRIVSDPFNAGPTILTLDADQRQVEIWLTAEMEITDTEVYDSTGAFDYSLTADRIKIIEKTVFTLNALGKTESIVRRELNHDDTDGMSSGDTDNIITYTYNFYDFANRLEESAHYGTNDSDGWENDIAAPMRGTKPGYGAGRLVTQWTYDAAGRTASITDPGQRITAYAYDDFGRVTTVTEDDTGDDQRKTNYKYNGMDSLTLLTAVDAAEIDATGGADDEDTGFDYDDLVNSDVLTKIRYPDPDTGAASSADEDTVTLTYHYDRTVKSREDQNGTIIDFNYDQSRRVDDLDVRYSPSYVDQAIANIDYVFGGSGRLEKVTSFDVDTIAVNEVVFKYDGFGKLTTDYQEHDGAKDEFTPYVGYEYEHAVFADEDTDNNWFNRLQKIRYPNADDTGRYVWLKYDDHTTGGIATLNDKLSRISRISDGSSSAATRSFVEYDFNGLGRMVQQDYLNDSGETTGVGRNGNETAERFISQGSATPTYSGFDRFGRLSRLRHVNYTGFTVGAADVPEPVYFNYGMDENSNLTYIEAVHNIGRSRAFETDRLNRLTADKMGVLNSNKDGIIDEWAVPRSDSWTLDAAGNWEAMGRANSGTAASSTREHNGTNEIKEIVHATEAARHWVNDTFTDAGTEQWVVADLNSGGGGGIWSVSSGQLQNDTVISVSGAPGTGGYASILLADAGSHQDFAIQADVTLVINGIGGLVYGYIDPYNFFALLANQESGKIELWEVTGNSGIGRTWTKRLSGGSVGAGLIVLTSDVRSGAVVRTGAGKYAGTIPQGQVGVYAGTGNSSVKIDDFELLDTGRMKNIDGRWETPVGDISLVSDKLEFGVALAPEKLAVRRGFRGSKYVVEVDLPTVNGQSSGVLLHYQDPENYMAFVIKDLAGSGNFSPRLFRRKDGMHSLVYTGTAFTGMTSGDRVRVAIHDDPADANLQELEAYVGVDSVLTSTAIDDDWSGGMVGLRVAGNAASVMAFDDFKVGFDNNADDDVGDVGDDVHIDDNFDTPPSSPPWTSVTLIHDKNGNLTDDGIYLYTYDAWDRVVKATYREDSKLTVWAAEYDGLHRMISTVTSNWGEGVVNGSDAGGITGIQAGDRTEHYYYAGWSMAELRDGSDNTLGQFVRGITGADGWVRYDRNTDVGTDDDCIDLDGSKSYHYHADRNTRVVMLTDTSGDVVERYEYDAYGNATVLGGGSTEAGNVLSVSSVGNPFMHQGLFFDRTIGSYQNRYRQYHSRLGRFMQRDPIGYRGGMNLYEYLGDNPLVRIDVFGLLTAKQCYDLFVKINNLRDTIAGDLALWESQRKNPPKKTNYPKGCIDRRHQKKMNKNMKNLKNNLDKYVHGGCAKLAPNWLKKVFAQFYADRKAWSEMPKDPSLAEKVGQAVGDVLNDVNERVFNNRHWEDGVGWVYHGESIVPQAGLGQFGIAPGSMPYTSGVPVKAPIRVRLPLKPVLVFP